MEYLSPEAGWQSAADLSVSELQDWFSTVEEALEVAHSLQEDDRSAALHPYLNMQAIIFIACKKSVYDCLPVLLPLVLFLPAFSFARCCKDPFTLATYCAPPSPPPS